MMMPPVSNQNHWWHDWDECVRGIHPYAPFKSQQSVFVLLTATRQVFSVNSSGLQTEWV